ncbi:hypothetical protein CN403_29805 [Bacillus cereus]|nr:hypothetical protein CN403_29805 [Bacillus cereus]
MTVEGKGKKIKGEYDKQIKSLWVQINHYNHKLKINDDIHTLFREIGRASNDLLFNKQSQKENFQKIYENEKSNIKIDKTIIKSSEEFFSGVFSYYFSIEKDKSDQIKKEAPDTSKFISNLLKEQNDFDGVKNYLIDYKILPQNYITKKEATRLGWSKGKDLHKFAPGKSIGGDVYHNDGKWLPEKDGRIWYEVDINYNGGTSRGPKRILFSNDNESSGTVREVTFIYKTENHYVTFDKLHERPANLNR